jgi:hypothetical protein
MKTAIERSAAGEEIDGQKWHLHTALSPSGGNPTAPEQFKLWGADKIHKAGPAGAYQLFFIRAGGKWYAAHADGAISCTVQTHKPFLGPTGEIAALEYLLATRHDTLEQAKNNVWHLEREIALLNNLIAAARF